MSKNKELGEEMWKNTSKVNGELLVMTYGMFVCSLKKNHKSNKKINKILTEIGSNIGMRLVEEFFCETELEVERNIERMADIIATVGFKMFLNLTPEIEIRKNSFDVILVENPLAEFVHLPETDFDQDEEDLVYCIVYCGVIQGALKAIGIEVECFITKCITKGDQRTVVSVEFCDKANAVE